MDGSSVACLRNLFSFSWSKLMWLHVQATETIPQTCEHSLVFIGTLISNFICTNMSRITQGKGEIS